MLQKHAVVGGKAYTSPEHVLNAGALAEQCVNHRAPGRDQRGLA